MATKRRVTGEPGPKARRPAKDEDDDLLPPPRRPAAPARSKAPVKRAAPKGPAKGPAKAPPRAPARPGTATGAKKPALKRSATTPRIHASHAEGSSRGLTRAPRPLQAPKAPPRSVRPTTVAADMPRPTRAAAKGKARSASVPPPEASTATRELALAIATAGIDKKATGIEILDVTGKVDYADFLVVMTGRSDRHVQSIAQGIEEALRRKNVRPISTEGTASATWVLMDYADVVVHVFQEDARQLYDIEGLWIDADRVAVKLDESPGRGAS